MLNISKELGEKEVAAATASVATETKAKLKAKETKAKEAKRKAKGKEPMIYEPKKRKTSQKLKGVEIKEPEEGDIVSMSASSGGYSTESGDYELRGNISQGSDSD